MSQIGFREWLVLLCPRCEGTFYHESTLDALLVQPDLRLSYLRPALLPNLATPHPEETDRDRIGCPTCRETMTREVYSPEDTVLVDRCPQGHGIWLDDGELGQLYGDRELKHPHPEPGFWEGLRRLVGLRPRLQLDMSKAVGYSSDSP
jgi:Zn-finger nucleic acid-binding protein